MSIYKQFNHTQTEDYRADALNNEELEHYFSNFKSSRTIKKKTRRPVRSLVTAAAAVLVLIPVAFNEDIQASVSTFLDDFSYSLTNTFSPNATEYASAVNQVLSFDNADIKLTDVLVDDQYITYNVLIDAKEDIEVIGLNSKPLEINGKTYTGGASGQLGMVDEENNVYSMVMTERLNEPVPDGELDISLQFSDFYYFQDGTELKDDMNAVYELTATKSLLTQDTHNLNLEKIYDVGDYDVALNQLILNPVTARIDARDSEKNLTYDMTFEDQSGKTYLFNLTSKSPAETENEFETVLTFNPEFSSGTIDDLNHADYLTPEFELSVIPESSGKIQDIKNPTVVYEPINLR
ncbi:DUF4179 domain-containing protein [Salinicoccus cyprini]|uniref:DUF4179 domain-containing protein n=1 Tax=Salinicoccus cyprini TaxID=2493691 RepID=A0A558AUZ4_9STAP|nr:DUF4179 domain-containing protein [Salinicoccus cyprini]TVT28081.1 DUF4179 domain-containing protein [Salinicoccus cyprini]